MSDNVTVVEFLQGRYSNAYDVAGMLSRAGSFIKVCAVLLSVLLIFVCLGMSEYLRQSVVLVLSVIVLAGCLLYSVGIFITALGQMLRALIDSAINTSPLVSPEAKAAIIGLHLPETAEEE